jgi:D,D-heptose 1,7-bisphosphate phosphatase
MKTSQKCNVAILAGGVGSRLKARSGLLPKPMVKILGKPTLEWQLELCKRYNFEKICLLVHYEHEVIRDYFGNGERLGVELTYALENRPRGTGGALRDALERFDDRFLVLYGDTFADIDLRAFWDAHASQKAGASLFLHPNDHPEDSDLVELDEKSQVLAIHSYPHSSGAVFPNIVNAALYVMERDRFGEVNLDETKPDIAKSVLPAMLKAGERIFGYVSCEYIKDMGTPERLDKVERDIHAGLPESLSLRKLRRAVFFDRDGTLNEEVGHLNRPEQLRLIPGSAKAISKLNRAGVLAVCVTNQPVVARGEVNEAELVAIHATLDLQLGKDRAYLDRLYFCPHHPHKGYEGEVSHLKIDCDCRKPNTGMIDRAVSDLLIARRLSWMVGDTTSDIRAGALGGLRTILVRTGHGGKDYKFQTTPDYIVPDSLAAVEWILHGHNALALQLQPLLTEAVNARLILVDGLSCAGKSFTAKLLSEQLAELGKSTKIFSYTQPDQSIADLPFQSQLAAPMRARPYEGGWIDSHDAPEVFSGDGSQLSSITPGSIVIVEGTSVFNDFELCEASQLRIWVETGEIKRRERLLSCELWQGASDDVVHRSTATTTEAVLGLTEAARRVATHVVKGSTT